MSEQSRTSDELALVLSRINALTTSGIEARTEAASIDATALAPDIPVLTEIYDGQDALSPLEIERLFAPFYQDQANQSTLEDTQAPVSATTLAEASDEGMASPIKFLPVEDNQQDGSEELWAEPEVSASPALLLARGELVETILTDMWPLVQQAVKQAVQQELQHVTLELEARLEQELTTSLRARIQQALDAS
ncbi:hypothetical protein LG201_10365 [Methylobacillus gramineus]|uniref:hypothetical protein n=1 Tax=Methylobacillus gramineus TaxID=755169 RepID=UPI001CFFAF27|nr:hypothetical protein [Methylobacillus gramineus]MCB5185606.1 hypothetical protein [Methylobacillus gramineus]